MKSTDVVRLLSALAQATRLDVYRLLVQQGQTGLAAGEIAQELDITPATLSFHLKELSHAGLVDSRHDGRFIFYTANYSTMNRLLGYLTENCCAADNDRCSTGSACAPTSSRKFKRKESA